MWLGSGGTLLLLAKGDGPRIAHIVLGRTEQTEGYYCVSLDPFPVQTL
jgi:hypothetical protein